MTFFSLISTAFSSIFYGIIATAVVMAILYAVLKSISKGIVQTPVFYITGVVLAILLIIQFSLAIGAVQAKESVASAELFLRQFLENSSGIVGAQDSQYVLDAVTQEYPIIGTYIGVADFSGNDVSNLPSVMHNVMTDYLNSFIWHRVWWILGMIIVACMVSMFFSEIRKPGMPKHSQGTRTTSRKNYDDF